MTADTPLGDQDGPVNSGVLKGKLLVATPLLREPTFARTVIVLLDHDADNGAFGVVINRPLELDVEEVVPNLGGHSVSEIVTAPRRLFEGGPVSPTTAIALGLLKDDGADGHGDDSDADGWTALTPPLVSVDLDYDPALLAVSLRGLRVFAGYAGWAAGQLEGEIEEGAWYVVDGWPEDAFQALPERLWSAVLRRQGWPLSLVAVCPVDPGMN